jgi:hypothetical protein
MGPIVPSTCGNDTLNVRPAPGVPRSRSKEWAFTSHGGLSINQPCESHVPVYVL